MPSPLLRTHGLPARVAFLLISLAAWLAVAEPASAQDCGREGQRPCLVTERLPSCDVNLVEGAGQCLRPACGRQGERPCGPLERVRFDFVLRLPVPQPCDFNLALQGSLQNPVCAHPGCGRENGAPCTIFVRIPSCDTNLSEAAGRCVRPRCGRLDEAPCDLLARPPFGGCDSDLVARSGRCARPGVADAGTRQAGSGAPPPPSGGSGAPPPPAGVAYGGPPPPPPPPRDANAMAGTMAGSTRPSTGTPVVDASAAAAGGAMSSRAASEASAERYAGSAGSAAARSSENSALPGTTAVNCGTRNTPPCDVGKSAMTGYQRLNCGFGLEVVRSATGDLRCAEAGAAGLAADSAAQRAGGAATAAATANAAAAAYVPQDLGRRDPVGFPRVEGLRRTKSSGNPPGEIQDDVAEYESPRTPDEIVADYLLLAKQTYWKWTGGDADGSGTGASRLIILSFQRDDQEAGLRVYGTEEGGSRVRVQVTGPAVQNKQKR